MKEIQITRKDFLKVAGVGATGTALLGAPMLGSGCSSESAANVIVVILDSLRKDQVGTYGNGRVRTPTLDALAQESLRFTNAYPDAMPTIPARRAIHTGMRTFPYDDFTPQEQKKAPVRGWLPIPENEPTLAEILKKEGYRTALVTDTYVQFPYNFQRGFDEHRFIRGQENDTYKNPASVSEEEMQPYLPIQEGEIRQYLANTRDRKTEEGWFAPKVFINAMEMLQEASGREQPFFLVVDSYDPHEPWDPPRKYADLYDPDGYDEPEPINPRYGKDDYLTDRQLLRMRALYSAEVTMVDHWLGNFVEKAYDLGVMENTVLVVISDHGHLLGEHGYTGKLSYALFSELTDIVLFVRHPEGKAAGDATSHYASTHDVAPTILGMLGVEPPKPMEGQDLSVLLDGEDPEPRDHFTLGYANYVRVHDKQYVMFARNDQTGAKLYDAQNDPREDRDLAKDDPDTIKRMFEEFIFKDAGGPMPVYGA